MKSRPRSYALVLVTCGMRREAGKIARSVVEHRLAACVNILEAPVGSVYRWKGKIELAREFLLLIKTTSPRLKALKAEIVRLHSYDVPEFIVLPIVAGSHKYLAWLSDTTSAEKYPKFSPGRHPSRRSNPGRLRYPRKAAPTRR